MRSPRTENTALTWRNRSGTFTQVHQWYRPAPTSYRPPIPCSRIDHLQQAQVRSAAILSLWGSCRPRGYGWSGSGPCLPDLRTRFAGQG